MDGKVIELMEKMYIDLKGEIISVKSELKDDVNSVRNELKADINSVRGELKNDIDSVRSELKNDINTVGNQVIRLENNLAPKVEALFDGYKQLAEGQEEIKSQISRLTSIVEKHDIEISILKEE